MTFGQQSGPPASAKQVQELLEMLRDAGHDGFRDARGPMGFTQRQAAGKFTRDEAAAFADQLQADAEGGASGIEAPPHVPEPDLPLRRVPSDQLAAELQRRGWAVIAP